MITILLILSLLLNVYSVFWYLTYYKNKAMEKQELVLTFLKGRDGRNVVARTQTGKVCLLDIPYCKQNNIYVKENEDWRCAIKEEKTACIIIQPITRTLTAEENNALYGRHLSDLVNKYSENKQQRRRGTAKTS